MIVTIQIHNAQIYTQIGVLEEEQTLGNRFIINLSADYDATLASKTDDVAHAVSYADLYEIVKWHLTHSHYRLMETLVALILDDIGNRYPQVERCTLSIQKVLPPIRAIMEGASVTATRIYR